MTRYSLLYNVKGGGRRTVHYTILAIVQSNLEIVISHLQNSTLKSANKPTTCSIVRTQMERCIPWGKRNDSRSSSLSKIRNNSCYTRNRSLECIPIHGTDLLRSNSDPNKQIPITKFDCTAMYIVHRNKVYPVIVKLIRGANCHLLLLAVSGIYPSCLE